MILLHFSIVCRLIEETEDRLLWYLVDQNCVFSVSDPPQYFSFFNAEYLSVQQRYSETVCHHMLIDRLWVITIDFYFSGKSAAQPIIIDKKKLWQGTTW